VCPGGDRGAMSDETIREAGTPPATIGRYQITGTLGSGAMGAVYKAFDPVIRRALAIKTIRLDVPRDSPQYKTFIERFSMEARSWGKLSHPGIVTLFDGGEERGLPFLAMEFIEGRTIASILEEGTRFKPERVVGLVSQVASALDYAHSRGVIHRDIKPSNLMVDAHDQVKVTDFGIAKLADAEITHSGTLVGTPSYMSPEQAMGEKLDGRSDIFSLGVCAFEMLSGEQPFPGSNVTSILYKLVHVPPVEPADLEMNGLLPEKWREVFNKVLAKKPENRYQTATAFVRDLEYCLGSWFAGLGQVAEAASASERTVVLSESTPVSEPTLRMPLEAVSALPPPEGGQPAPSTRPPARPPERAVSERPAEASQTVEAEATVRLAVEPPAVEEAAVPTVALTSALPPEAAQTLPPQATGSVSAAPAPAPRRRAVGRKVPPSWLLGGAAVLVLALGLLGWSLRSGARKGAVPEDAAVTEPAVHPVEPTPAGPTEGTLRVVAEPAGARVLVNGKLRGEAPLELSGMPFGAYQVRVESKGYAPETRDLTLSAESATLDLRVALARAAVPAPASTGLADFVSTPPGAAVSVDGRAVGRTPLADLPLHPGTRKIEMSLEGHQPWSGAVFVTAGRKDRVEAQLRPLASEPPPPPPVDTTRIYPNATSDVDVLARKTSGNSPSYPQDRAPRLRSGERVSVTVRFVVDETGGVNDVRVVESGGSALDQVVVSAIRGWRFRPAMKRGVPVKVEVTFKQTFLGG
jgi:TonB family protein